MGDVLIRLKVVYAALQASAWGDGNSWDDAAGYLAQAFQAEKGRRGNRWKGGAVREIIGLVTAGLFWTFNVDQDAMQ